MSTRVLIIENDCILSVRHQHDKLNINHWVLPGGAVDKNEPLARAAIREVKEETGLDVALEGLIKIRDFIYPNYIEFIFLAKVIGGETILGFDPEKNANEQYLKEVKWINVKDLDSINFKPSNISELISNIGNKISIPDPEIIAELLS
jgi:8-oxo-dGTP diphosphatase